MASSNSTTVSDALTAIPVPPAGSVLALAREIVPNSFEEKLAKDLRVCPSTGKSVSIAYHTFGESSNPLVLLIPGMNGQGTSTYDTAACTWLAGKGFYVVRMDNRDVGLSTTFDDVPQKVNMFYGYLLPGYVARWFGEKQPYTLDDMADDASALIKYLCAQNNANAAAAPAAHVVGVSMGGMIAQCVGLRNPELVRSLTLVMTHSGNHGVARAPISTLSGFLYKPKSSSVEHLVEFRAWFVDNYLTGVPLRDRTLLRLTSTEFTHRSLYRGGIVRHTTALSRAPSRDEALAAKFGGDAPPIPIHIMHGGRDRIVPVGNGYHLSKLLPSAKLSIFPEMGHYIDDTHTQPFWDAFHGFLEGLHP